MRPGAVAAVSIVSALLGGLGALGLAEATGWVEDTETVLLATPPARQGAQPARVELESTAKPLDGDEFDPARIYAERADGVVTIYAVFAAEVHSASAQGSGFVVSKDGLVLTNSHVVTNAGEQDPDDDEEPPEVIAARRVYVQFRDGDRVPARIVGWDPFTDVAVLRVDPRDHQLVAVPLGDSSRVIVGEPVAAIGSPFGNANSLSVGIVSATGRSVASLTSIYDVVDAIQTDAPINRGNSGGPLFDAEGRVIGVNAQIRSESGRNEGVGFAIPINAARRSLDQLVATGEVSYAYVGVRTMDLTPSVAERFGISVRRGALVTEVEDGTPARRAGLRGGTRDVEFNGLRVALGGDVIVAIDGVAVRSADDVVRYVAHEARPGDVALFTVVRNDERRRVAVRLGERPLPGR